MIVAIHQPHYLPWLGYLDRMRQADLFVVLDHVQFERRNYQNRTHILLDSQPHWLTVPVIQRSQLERIYDKRIANNSEIDRRFWGERHANTLLHAYREAPFFKVYANELRQILTKRWDRLVDLNQETLRFLRQAFAIETPVIFSSSLHIKGARSEMILNICRAVGADTYLAGLGGSRQYLDRTRFAEAGINVAWQDFQHPIYTQCGSGAFIPGLSAVDLLFNQGPLARGILAAQGRSIPAEAVA